MNFLFNIPADDLIYDIETYPNIFTATFRTSDLSRKWVFEISPWRNDLYHLCLFIDECILTRVRWVGYNNQGFDYPVVDFIYRNQRALISYVDIYNKAMSIIRAPQNAKFAHIIWGDDQLVPQVDLYKIHHFDNISKATSLKVLEFNMRSDRVEDLPFPVGTELTREQADILLWYNDWDVCETGKFYQYSLPAITMRENLSATFRQNMMNNSDVKIGEKILISKLEEAGISCYAYVDGKRKMLQTDRPEVRLGDLIFPYIKFERREFQEIKDQLASKVLHHDTKGVFKDLIATVDGIEYKFGTGGLHGSVESRIVRSDNEYQLVDVDFTSYYPNIAIKNGLYPAHLGSDFCVAYESLYENRKNYPKGSPENEAYKLACNGSYGNSNNPYSPLYDPAYTMTITINGQLILAMLIEQMIKIPGLQMVQANTDGITYLCPRWAIDHTLKIIDWCEEFTKLSLEEVHYDSMFIRDVNSYIAVKEDGKVKRIGAYAHETAAVNPGTRELPWHKDWSFRIVPLAAEAVLVRQEPLRDFILSHRDVYDFLGRTKVPRNSVLEWGGDRVPNIVRYFVSTTGKRLEKVMPANGPVGEYKRANKLTDNYFYEVMQEIGPGVWDERIHTKNKSVYEERRIGICTGWHVELCNNLSGLIRGCEEQELTLNDIDLGINYDFYIKETEKLIHLMES